MLYKICYIFLLFIIYSFLGWIVEVIANLIENKKFINRGFLIGPYCPIYGVGLLIIINFLKSYVDSYIIVFVMSMFICMTLEYLTSYVMEKLFNARWWDYSDKKFNINGRVCLETTIPFGLGGMAIMYIVNPFLDKILNLFSNNVLIIISSILFLFFLTDLIISLIVILKVKDISFKKIKDNTEEINRKVKDYLMNKSILNKRLIESFPRLKLKFIQKRKNN